MSHCVSYGGAADFPPRGHHVPSEPARVSDDQVRTVCRLAATWLRTWNAQIREPVRLPDGTIVRNRMDHSPDLEENLERLAHNAMAECVIAITDNRWRWSPDASVWTYIAHIECEDRNLTPTVRRFFRAAYDAFLNELGSLFPEKPPREAWREMKDALEETERAFNLTPPAIPVRSHAHPTAAPAAPTPPEAAAPPANGSNAIDCADIVERLRKAGKRTSAMLVEYMADKRQATAADIAERVHDTRVSIDAIRKNVARTNGFLVGIGSRLSFRVASDRVFREISPE
ncbi:hypothetical protein [Planctomyces sp. SH-PL62]|uniref:hypothetical protein n=1 Tax=Planctomyces sp. SH-PL62 TaxID=1636152 RepID=UPI00078DAB0E|nr:hypothetical protein [Planctomyces sp. SH-PL62]AMV38780.1 hypothetical protein VT85_15185 [Planctomyces sp. SH-PL62]